MAKDSLLSLFLLHPLGLGQARLLPDLVFGVQFVTQKSSR